MTISSDTSIDLQTHTIYSDGYWSAEQLFEYLVQEGFGLVAVTDHDHIDTVAGIQQLGARKQVLVLAAVEVNTQWRRNIGDVLCFGFDPHEQALREITDQIRQKAATNAHEVYEELLRLGYRTEYPASSAFPAEEHERKSRLMEAIDQTNAYWGHYPLCRVVA